jgi:predicted nucleic acid-binding protein
VKSRKRFARCILRRDIAAALGLAALDDLAKFPLHHHALLPLVPPIWELRHNSSAHDAACVAPAEFLGAPLVTPDRRFAASSGHRARIEPI